MNAILIGPCKSRIPIDGSLSNAFEYFYFAWLHNKNIILIIDTTFESLEIVKKYLEQSFDAIIIGKENQDLIAQYRKAKDDMSWFLS